MPQHPLTTKEESKNYEWKDLLRLPIEDCLNYLKTKFDQIDANTINGITSYHLIYRNSELKIDADNEIEMIKKACLFLQDKYGSQKVYDCDISLLFI